MGRRRRLLRHAEVPRRAARARAGQLLARARSSGCAAASAPAQSWYLDLGLLADYVGTARRYHHTAPISMLYALHAGLGVLLDEGLEASWARHRRVGALLQDALPELGFRPFAQERRLPQLTSVWLPDGVDDAKVRGELRTRFDIEVGGGLGELAGKGWRIGLMGHSRARAVGDDAARRAHASCSG